MRQLASGEKTQAQLVKILKNCDHDQFMRALAYCTDHGYGKAKETIEHTGSLTLEHFLDLSRK